MSNVLSLSILGFTTLASGLVAGLFYAWSCSVSPGLGRLPDAGYLTAMQEINRAILNPAFFATFVGTLILLPVSCWVFRGDPRRFRLLLIASVLYAAAVFGVTLFRNVPMNEQLDRTGLQGATPAEFREYRERFEGPWNRWNRIRTMAAVVVASLTILACLPEDGEF